MRTPCGSRDACTGFRDGGARTMRIGVPSEIKSDEYRVAITPAGVRELSARGHEVLVQAGAGEGSAMADAQFQAQGAAIVARCEARVRAGRARAEGEGAAAVEVGMLHEGQTLFTYLHLAAEPELARGLQRIGRDLYRL